MASDPFVEVKTDVIASLGVVEDLQAALRRRHEPVAQKRLVSELSQVAADLDAMEGAVQQIELNRAKFKVDDAELESRRTFIRTSRAVVSAAQDEVAQHQGNGGACSDGLCAGKGDAERESLLGGSCLPAGRRQEAADAQSSALLGEARQQQQLEIAQQDEVLDTLHGAVGRLKNMSGAMNEELAQQNQIMGDLENQIDSTAASLDSLKERLKKLIPKHERGKVVIIVFLTILLVVLASMAFS